MAEFCLFLQANHGRKVPFSRREAVMTGEKKIYWDGRGALSEALTRDERRGPNFLAA
jgi:hypothetical protein